MSYKTIAEKSETPIKENNIFVDELGKLKDKRILLCQKDNEIKEGNLIAVDNRLNIVLEMEDGIEVIRGNTILYLVIHE
ncbi:MAG: LSM domain protein [Euryarchaeota archaeon]|nr:LSM domain protein [Euryarchaeota archaeon]